MVYTVMDCRRGLVFNREKSFVVEFTFDRFFVVHGAIAIRNRTLVEFAFATNRNTVELLGPPLSWATRIGRRKYNLAE